MKNKKTWILIGAGIFLSILLSKIIVHNVPGSEEFF